MKNLFEGATVVSIVFLLCAAIGLFLFNVNSQALKTKHRRRTEKKIEKLEKKHYDLQDKQADEIEYYKQMSDPMWYLYEGDTEEQRTTPGYYYLYD